MRIGFDAKRAVRNFTGLGNYSRFVIEALAGTFPDENYLLYTPKPPATGGAFSLTDSMSIRLPKPGKNGSWWRSRGILTDLKKDKADIFHGLSNELPFGVASSGIKTVVTIHDLIFLRYPNFYPWFDRQVYNLKFRYACRHADRIVAVSEQTKKDIIRYYEVPESRIEVVYQDCNEIFQKRFSSQEKEAVKTKYDLPESFILNVGTIEERKNLLLIARALKELPESLSLVVVGKRTPYAKKVKKYLAKHNLTQRVHFLSDVAYADLPLIYQQAQVFVYPSRFEGFGIPIVEALHSAVPVVAAEGSCLEEAGGPQTLYVNPDDSSQLAASIRQIWDDRARRTMMVEAGLAYVSRFSKETIARRMMDIYQNLLSNDQRGSA